MKRILVFVMCAAMLASLCACGAAELPASQSEPMQETLTAEPVREELPVERTEPVCEVRSIESIVLREEGIVPGKMEAPYRLPGLSGPFHMGEAFENWVDKVFDDWKHDITWLAEDGKCSLDYRVDVYDNILSVQFMVNEGEFADTEKNGIISIDLNTGEELTVEGILDRADVTWELLEERIREELNWCFGVEDSEYGEIQDVQPYRAQMLSSQNLRNVTVQMSPFANGEVCFRVPNNYYVDSNGKTPKARTVPVNDVCYEYRVYLNLSSAFVERAVAEDASAWIEDGEKGTDGEYRYCLPKLKDEKIDADAFSQWTDACLREWKDQLRYAQSGVDNNLNYRAFVIGDVLSVALTTGGSLADLWNVNPSISFSLTTGKQLYLEDMMAIAGVPVEKLPDLLTDSLESLWGWEKDEYGSMEGIEEFHRAVLSEENLAKTEFTLWPGDLKLADWDTNPYPAGCVTLNVWIPYQIADINGIYIPEMGNGYMYGYNPVGLNIH